MKTMVRLTVAIAMMFAINNSAFAAHYEGDAGPNAWYEMDTETGIMRIYGNGELYNYHGSWTYYSSYSQLDHTGNGVTGTQNGAQCFWETNQYCCVCRIQNAADAYIVSVGGVD